MSDSLRNFGPFHINLDIVKLYVLQGIATYDEQTAYNDYYLGIKQSRQEINNEEQHFYDITDIYDDATIIKHPIKTFRQCTDVDILSDNRIEQFFKSHNVTNIDYDKQICFCDKEQKWYGWCKRTAYGFKIGDRGHDQRDLGTCNGYAFKPSHKLANLNECKQRAIDFVTANKLLEG